MKAKHQHTYIFVFTFWVFSLSLFSQNPKRIALQNETWNYIDLIETLEKQLEKGNRSTSTYEILGDAYFAKGNYLKALSYYQNLEKQVAKMPKERLFRYIQCLKTGGAFAKAEQYKAIFSSKYPDDSRSKHFKNQEKPQVLDWEIKKLDKAPFNSSFSDYGLSIIHGEGYFVSTRDTLGWSRRRHGWTGERFSNVYKTRLDSAEVLTKPEKVKKLSSRYNESMVVQNPLGNQLWITRNYPSNTRKKRSNQGVLHTGIYILETINGKEYIVPSSFCSKEYSYAHPTFDGKGCVYFAANLPDSKGQTDLYQSCFENGNWTAPKNLGDAINTEGRENFPVFHENKLYFASEGLPGLGGYDIWFVEINEQGQFGIPIHLPQPINSPFDDFAFWKMNDETAYFSSNRDPNTGDDIYKVSWQKKIPPCFVDLTFKAIDVITGETIEKTHLNWQWKWEHNELSEFTDAMTLQVNCNQIVIVDVTHPDYEPGQAQRLPDDANELIVYLVKKPKQPQVGDDLAKLLAIEQIYFDLDRWHIREDAALELQKIKEVLLQFPEIKIDIRSHTDSRASDTYNLYLSEKRAQSTKQWLIEQGISVERLHAKGYGETQLLNHCKNGINCTEEEHQRNRRSEFIIVE